MIPLHDEDRDPLQVWKRSLSEDEQDEQSEDIEESVRHGVIASMVVVCGVILTVIIGTCIGGYLLFDKYKHLFGL